MTVEGSFFFWEMCFSFIRCFSFLIGGYETGAGSERAGVPETPPPPGRREGAIAHPPARPGGRSSPSRHDGREGHGQVFPPVNELVDLDVHLLAGRRRPEPDRVQAGDVGRALHGGRAHADDPEVPAGLTTLAERLAAADDGVRPGVAGTAQLEGNRAPGVGDGEAGGRQVGELRTLP